MRMSEWIEPGLTNAFAAEGTDAYRLCTFPDGWAERFGQDVLLSYKSEAARERLTTGLFNWARPLGLNFARVFGRFLPKQNAERHAPLLLVSETEMTSTASAMERGLRYGIDFSSGYSPGLFLDQRENRAFVRGARPKKMLNCFAYTCSFSIVAAASGANTMSVDLSKKSLARGRENFSLNSISSEGHRFLAEDVIEYLPRLARKGEKFDFIILDPPTFSRSHRGRSFQVERDFEPLLLAALEVAEREGHILLSTNCTSLDVHALDVMARYCLKASRRAGTLHREPGLPDFPAETAASTVWLSLR